LRSEPELSIPQTPMEIATEMSRLVLEMREPGKSGKLKQRLELLAGEFLRVTGQESDPNSTRHIESGKSSHATLTM
jgi:hypothetical protein